MCDFYVNFSVFSPFFRGIFQLFFVGFNCNDVRDLFVHDVF